MRGHIVVFAPSVCAAQADEVADREVAAYRLLERLRWPDRALCAHCGSASVRLLVPVDGRTRRTRNGARSVRRVWRCASCRRQFSVLTNTVLHGTRIPLSAWVGTANETARVGRAPRPRAVVQSYGVSRDAASRMCATLAAAARVARSYRS